MNNNKVFIVKMKYDEMNHFSKVKRVFFEEQNAMDFIDEMKKEDKYKDAFWIISDREIVDYEPCISDEEMKLIKVEAVQLFIEEMISESTNFLPHDVWDYYLYLEDQWGVYESRRIELEDKIKEI